MAAFHVGLGIAFFYVGTSEAAKIFAVIFTLASAAAELSTVT
jgi:hypothetical protein